MEPDTRHRETAADPAASVVKYVDAEGYECVPVCPNQERVLLGWSVAQRHGVTPKASLIKIGLNLTGRIDLGVLQDGLRRLLVRHPVLNITFGFNSLIPPPQRDRVIQSFSRTNIFTRAVYIQSIRHRQAEIQIGEYDVSGQAVTEQAATLKDLIGRESERDFRLSDSPRLRGLLFKRGSDHHVLVLLVDHLVCDGVSAGILRDELRDLLRGRQPDSHGRNELRDAFLDFCVWQTRALNTTYFDSSLAYWREQWVRFSRARIAASDLPFATTTTTARSSGLFVVRRQAFTAGEGEDLRLFARKTRTTLFMVLISALAIVLGRYTAKRAVAIWTHLANRVSPDVAGAVGWFSNSHILPFSVSDSMRGIDFLINTREVVTEALRHQELPLQHVWNTLQVFPRFPDASILMDYIRGWPGSDAEGTVTVSKADLPDTSTPRFSKLGVYIIDDEAGLSLRCEYLSDRFTGQGVQELLEDVCGVALQMCRRAEESLVSYVTARRGSARPGNEEAMSEFLLFDSARMP